MPFPTHADPVFQDGSRCFEEGILARGARLGNPMSKTCCVTYGDRNFWAFDQSLSILLWFMLRADASDPTGEFLDEEVEQWRVTAFLGSDVGLPLGRDWTSLHVKRFTALVRTCAQELEAIGELDGEAVLSWSLGEGHHVIWRLFPTARISTRPIVVLAEAMVRLVSGELEKPPSGHWWTFGFEEDAGLISMGGFDRG